ncbi:hypothetical protein ACTHH6_005033, partial [Escherichia coli]
MLNTSQFSQLIVACLIIDVLQNFCMVNPPERRGISASQVFLFYLYPFCAGSGADTELTGRHPAPCKIVYTTTVKSPSPEGLFYGQKKALSEWRAGRMNIHQVFLLSCSDF